MKNSLIFTFVRYSENSMVASVRIARFLSGMLDVPVVDQTNIDKYLDKKLDTLIIMNGAYAFCKCLPELAELITTARRIVWVQNDYTIIPPKMQTDATSPFRAAWPKRLAKGLSPPVFWSTCDEYSKLKGNSYVNWNALTFDERFNAKKISAIRMNADDDLLYYGSFRNGTGKSSRLAAFDRYFANPTVKTVVSSPSDKFKDRYTHKLVTHIGPIENVPGMIWEYGMGLYIEDRKSSENFHSPANRFYEMLSAGLPMVFQPECGTMLRRAGYDPTPYVAENARSMMKLMDRREFIGREQREKWASDPHKFRRTLLAQINDALEKLK